MRKKLPITKKAHKNLKHNLRKEEHVIMTA